MSDNTKDNTSKRISVFGLFGIVLSAVAIIRTASIDVQVSESLTLLKYAFIPVLCFALLGSESLSSGEESKYSFRSIASFVSTIFILSVALVFLRWVPEHSLTDVKVGFTKTVIFFVAIMLLFVAVNYVFMQRDVRKND